MPSVLWELFTYLTVIFSDDVRPEDKYVAARQVAQILYSIIDGEVLSEGQ